MTQSLDRAARKVSIVMIALVLLCGGAGLWSVVRLGSALTAQEEAAGLLRNHMTADMMHDAIRSDVLAALASSNPATGISIDEVRTDLAEHLETLAQGVAADAAYEGSEEVAAATARLSDPATAYADAARRIVDTARTDGNAALRQLPDFFRQFRVLEDSMGAATDVIQQHAVDVAESAKTESRFAMALVILALLASAGATLAASRAVRRHLVQPLLALAGVMRQLAGGDLKADVPSTDRQDELGTMAKAMAEFRDQLQAAEAAKAEQARLIVESIGAGLGSLAEGDLTAEVRAELSGPFARLKTDFNEALGEIRVLIAAVLESTRSIRSGAAEIANASEDLARRTEQNAASLEETSAALTQIDERLKVTAAAATRTLARADEALATVGSGRGTAGQAVQAMERVSECAKGIDSVIEGMDKIAFQTRVLAMNAAVEAGRAGEAGRGFAVVADLVSALAMRAEEEAKRAREELTVTQSEIGTAVEAVQQVDGALVGIADGVAEVHGLLGTMTGDNQAQSSALSQVSAAIATMDQSTQQTAAMVEETSAAARNLTNEVDALAEQAGRFEIGTAAAAPSPPRRTSAGNGAHVLH